MPKVKQHSIVQKSYQCQFCKVRCRRPQDLRRHLLVHAAASFECDLCGNKFTRFDTLCRHKRDNCRNAQSIRRDYPVRPPPQRPSQAENQPSDSNTSSDTSLKPTESDSSARASVISKELTDPYKSITPTGVQLSPSAGTSEPNSSVSAGISPTNNRFYVPSELDWHQPHTQSVSAHLGIFHPQHHHITTMSSLPIHMVQPHQPHQLEPPFYPSHPTYVHPASHMVPSTLSIERLPHPTSQSSAPHQSPTSQQLQQQQKPTNSLPIYKKTDGETSVTHSDYTTNFKGGSKRQANGPRFQSQQVPQLHNTYATHYDYRAMPPISSALRLNPPGLLPEVPFGNVSSLQSNYTSLQVSSESVQQPDLAATSQEQKKYQLMPIEPKARSITHGSSPVRFDEYKK